MNGRFMRCAFRSSMNGVFFHYASLNPCITLLSDTRFAFAGKVYSPVMPLPIPVYMTIQLAPAVGIVGGTTDDFRKVLADIEEQMTDGITQVEDYDGMCIELNITCL